MGAVQAATEQCKFGQGEEQGIRIAGMTMGSRMSPETKVVSRHNYCRRDVRACHECRARRQISTMSETGGANAASLVNSSTHHDLCGTWGQFGPVTGGGPCSVPVSVAARRAEQQMAPASWLLRSFPVIPVVG